MRFYEMWWIIRLHCRAQQRTIKCFESLAAFEDKNFNWNDGDNCSSYQAYAVYTQ